MQDFFHQQYGHKRSGLAKALEEGLVGLSKGDIPSLKLTAGTSKCMVGQKERFVFQLPMAPFFRDYNHMAHVSPRKLGK